MASEPSKVVELTTDALTDAYFEKYFEKPPCLWDTNSPTR